MQIGKLMKAALREKLPVEDCQLMENHSEL